MPHFTSSRPKVFLSHSKADIDFIQRLDDDLRHCQVDPWLDSVEIRHGQPWLDAIFEGGIPTCDTVLVYLTPESIQSPMVKKEIDAAIIKKLRDSHIGFLPYVSDAKLRDMLRPDIQALQTPEWNEKNYSSMLPKVVAEIWHGFLDRVVISVADAEKVRRLEAELELERLKKSEEGGIFSGQETSDLEYIWKRLDRYEPVEFQRVRHGIGAKLEVLETFGFRVHLQNLVANLDASMGSEYNIIYLRHSLLRLFTETLSRKDDQANGITVVCSQELKLSNELLMYGFLQRYQKTETPGAGDTFQLRTSYSYSLSEKFYRFKYWLAYNGKLSDTIKWEQTSVSPTAPGSTVVATTPEGTR
jgi:hypothetical protein